MPKPNPNYDLTPSQIAEIKRLCADIAAHPKANPALRTYSQALANGLVEQEGNAIGRLQDAIQMQLAYIDSNFASVRNAELVQMKKDLRSFQREKMID